jgi:hypothetical protein
MLENPSSNLRHDPSLQISFPFQGRWVRKVFVRGLGVPRRQVYGALRAIKSCLMPRQVRMRRQCAEEIAASGSEPLSCLEAWQRAGHRALRPAELGDLEPILTRCRTIRHDAEEERDRDSDRAKEFLHYVAVDQDFLAHPSLVRFALSEPILRAVSVYLGTVPVLASVALLWSPPETEGAKLTSSQRFHNDHEDTSQVKLFVHIDDVDSDCGVFTFHPAEATRRIRKALGTRGGRLDDAATAKVLPSEAPLTLMGPAGSAYFVDTSRCLHFGSRPAKKGRLLLQVQYLRCNSPAHSQLALGLDEKWAAESWSSLQRMVLGLRDVDRAAFHERS